MKISYKLILFKLLFLFESTHIKIYANIFWDNIQICSVKFDSQGERLAVGKLDGTIFLWDIERHKVIWSSQDANKPIFNLFFFNNDEQLIACEYQGNLKIFDVNSGLLIKNIELNFCHFIIHKEEYNTEGKLVAVDYTQEKLAAVDLCGNILAVSGNQSSMVTLIDIKKAINNYWESEIIFDKGNFYIVSETGRAYWVRNDKIKSNAVIANLFHQPSHAILTDIHYDPSHQYLGASTSTGYLVVWDINKYFSSNQQSLLENSDPSYIRKITTGRDEYKELTGLAFSTSGHLITMPFSCHKYGQIQLWNTSKGEMVHSKFEVHPGRAWKGAFDRSGKFAITMGDIRFILWDIKNDKLYAKSKIHYNTSIYGMKILNTIHFSPKENIVALGVLDVFILDLSTMKIIEHIGSEQDVLLIDHFTTQPR